MIERLGEIVGEDGEIDRSRMAERVAATARLSPGRGPGPPEGVTEVPLLYEVAGEKRFDKVVVITAPEKLREARARVPLAGRADRLLAEREKGKRADYVYVSTRGLEELDEWVAGVMDELRASRAPPPHHDGA